MQFKSFSNWLFSICFCLLAFSALGQNADEDAEKPNQLDVFKVNVLQLAINEARLSYEMEIRPHQSLEFGAGYIYPNQFWFAQGDRPLLATGGGVYFSYRKYRVPKRYFSAPFFTSYVSPLLFYRYSAYENEWLLFQGPSPETSECAQYSERFQQLGLVIRLGGQTTQGRLVMDMYTGIGVKYIPSTLTQHVYNAETDICEIIPTSDLNEEVTQIQDFQVIFNAGLKLGLRRKNRERSYEERGVEVPTAPQDDAPPAY